jgi:lysozyme
VNISEAGIKAIEGYEGVRLTAYADSIGVATIGVGHTLGVKLGDTITQDQADEFLRADLEDAEYAVNKYVTVALTQGQVDSLTSFVFNLGAGAFKGSTLLADLNAGKYDDAADQLLRWNRAGGQVLAGLTKRRISERCMFLTGVA